MLKVGIGLYMESTCVPDEHIIYTLVMRSNENVFNETYVTDFSIPTVTII